MASKTKDPKWLTMAEALLKELPSRPDDADPQVERLDWRLQEQMDRIVAAARLKPEGVKPAQCRDWPQVIEDAPVAAWWTQRRLAALYGVDERTVQRWESRGLPNFGAGPTKRYPIPQATVWCSVYGAMRRAGRNVRYLPMGIAFGENDRDASMLSYGRMLRVD